MEYLNPDKMPEAEVSIRLAEYLSDPGKSSNHIEVAIDGAQVKIGKTNIFPLKCFMKDTGWSLKGGDKWRGRYCGPGLNDIVVHSSPGRGGCCCCFTNYRPNPPR